MKWNGTHEHVFESVVRKNGRRVRYGCNSCPKIGPWVTFVDENDVPQTKFQSMTVAALRAEAKIAGLVGYSKMTKGELVMALETEP